MSKETRFFAKKSGHPDEELLFGKPDITTVSGMKNVNYDKLNTKYEQVFSVEYHHLYLKTNALRVHNPHYNSSYPHLVMPRNIMP